MTEEKSQVCLISLLLRFHSKLVYRKLFSIGNASRFGEGILIFLFDFKKVTFYKHFVSP